MKLRVANDMYVAYAHTHPLLKHKKCSSKLTRGFLINLKVFLEEYINGTRFNAMCDTFLTEKVRH